MLIAAPHETNCVSSQDPAKKLSALLKSLRARYGESAADQALEGCPAESDPLLWQLVYGFMLWESSATRAVPANKKLHASVVDYNELRVCLPEELAGMIGDRYPRAPERVTRLRSTLNDLYRKEHAVSIAKLVDASKRDARLVLESLEGMPHFVAARLMLLALGGHAFPIDDRIHQALVSEGAAPEDLDEASSWLERQFRVGEAAPAYALIEAWMNDRPLPRPPSRSTKRSRAKTDDEARPARRPVEKPATRTKKSAKS